MDLMFTCQIIKFIVLPSNFLSLFFYKKIAPREHIDKSVIRVVKNCINISFKDSSCFPQNMVRLGKESDVDGYFSAYL